MASSPACYSPLGKYVAPALMSVTTEGSIRTERAIKHLKNGVLSKERSNLTEAKAKTCVRVGMNINLCYKTHAAEVEAILVD